MKFLMRYINLSGFVLVLLSLILLLSACQDGATPAPPTANAGPTSTLAIVSTAAVATPTPSVNRKLGYAPDANPVAKVDGVAISADDFNRAVDEGRALAEEQADGKLDWNTPESVELLKNIRLQSLEGLINYQVVAAVAAKENVTASPAEVQIRLDELRKQFASPDDYKGWLARRFLSEEDLKKRLAQTVIFEEMSERHSKVEEKGEQAHVRHILVQTEPEARTLFQRLQQGGDFAALAKQFSLDFTSAAKGGDLEWVFRGQTEAPFENAAFSLPPNQTSGPIKTEKGYHLLQVLAREVRPLPIDLVAQRREEAFGNYIKNLRDKAKIERLLNL